MYFFFFFASKFFCVLLLRDRTSWFYQKILSENFCLTYFGGLGKKKKLSVYKNGHVSFLEGYFVTDLFKVIIS